MTDFLLELRSEEIPARMQAKAREDLAKLFTAELAAAGLPAPAITTYATPRRLTLIARDLPLETAAVSEEIKGPKSSAPPQALDGFLRKTGLTREQLVERDGVLFAVIDKPGRATADVLADAIPRLIRAFPWPKSMRWGDASLSTESLKWVRPLQGIVALLGGEVVPCEIAGIASGRETMGHRFHSSGAISIENAASYADQLRDAYVIVDQDERAQIIALGATMAARKAGLELIKDEGLLIENAGLTEWPVPLLGRFDAAFLEVPPEVIQLTARVNQKYFVCSDAEGKLANAFVCTANIDAEDGGARIIEGNRKVLAARLSDAKFFYDTDLKVPLEEQAKKLDRIWFHEKLGTVADRALRVGRVAARLAGYVEGDGAEQAIIKVSYLAKADLVTSMVGEFPELQGIMGGYYAKGERLPDNIVRAISDHYLPGGQAGRCPTETLTRLINVADQMDLIASFFVIGERPTGSRDPFGVRRSALSLLRLIIENSMRGGIRHLLEWSLLQLGIVASDNAAKEIATQFDLDAVGASDEIEFNSDEKLIQFRGQTFPLSNKIYFPLLIAETIRDHRDTLISEIFSFLIDRLKVQQREAGVRHDLIDAVFALGGEDDLVRLLARVHALQAFVGTDDGANLLAGYKRAANILKKEAPSTSTSTTTPVTPAPVPGSTAPQETAADGAQWDPEQVRGDDAGGAGVLPYTPEPAEAALIAALAVAEPAAAAAVAREDFESAMAALASLRAPIDAFFETVIVNDPDPAKRAARLALLEKVRDAVHGVADFSKIEG